MRTLLLCSLLIGCSSPSDGDKTDSGSSHDHSSHGDTDLPDDFDGAQEQLSSDGLALVSYTTETGDIPESTEFSISISLMDPDPTSQGTLLSNATVTAADATMPSHGGHGMTVTPVVTDNGDGTATAAPIKLHMPGYWVLHVDFEVDGVMDTVDFDIDCCD